MQLRDAHFYSRPQPPVGESPFAGDLLKRKVLAEKLTQYVDRLRDGCVIAIDAPWGAGKTWFGRNWQAQLSLAPDGHRTIFVDAFQRDYSDDPLTVLASEILTLIDHVGDPQRSASFKRAAVDVMKRVAPTAGKVVMHGILQAAATSIGMGEQIKGFAEKVEDALADGAERYLEKRLESAEEERKSIDHFRAQLRDFAATQTKPVIFFIDELDRCRPDFAVGLIERLKHLFDVPNLVFVLLLNREQLEHAIRGTYGQGVDAGEYLGKFIHLFFSLPPIEHAGYGDYSPIGEYIDSVLARYNIPSTHDTQNFSLDLAFYAPALKLTLRDIDKCVALFAIGFANGYGGYLAWVAALKVKRQDLVARLLAWEQEAHREAASMIRGDELSHAASSLRVLHKAIAFGQEELNADELVIYQRSRYGASDRSMLRTLFARIDVALAT